MIQQDHVYFINLPDLLKLHSVKKYLFSIAAFFLIGSINAQDSKWSLGLDLFRITGGTMELTSQYQAGTNFAIGISAGAKFPTTSVKKYAGEEAYNKSETESSGFYLRLSPLFTVRNKEDRQVFTIGPELTLSSYDISSKVIVDSYYGPYSRTYSASGGLAGFGVVGFFSIPFSETICMDLGGRAMIHGAVDMPINIIGFNQPGMGWNSTGSTGGAQMIGAIRIAL